MGARIIFAAIAGFFILMNVLLWRSEFTERKQGGTPVDRQVVLERIITAPDISSLEITQKGEKIGYGRWIPFVGEPPQTSASTLPEGMVRETTGYTIDFNGTLNVDETNRLRFNCDLKLGTNRTWQEFIVRLHLRPTQWEIRSVASEATLTLNIKEGDQVFQRVFTYTELRDPAKLLGEFGGPLVPTMLAAMGVKLPAAEGMPLTASLGLRWEAHNAWLRFGHSRIRVYRLAVRLLERFGAVIYVSPVGELLRVELPGDVLLVNDAMMGL
jgi:hypothetical protein